jgi:hypothetical protein
LPPILKAEVLMPNANFLPYDDLSSDSKQMLMSYAAHWLSLKPELIGEVKTDKELIDRLISFAGVLYEYFPKYKSSAGSSHVSA